MNCNSETSEFFMGSVLTRVTGHLLLGSSQIMIHLFSSADSSLVEFRHSLF